jgi:tetratricopeptide (TPR) repeat protein
MGRFYLFLQSFKPIRTGECILVRFIFFALICQSVQAQNSASLRGLIRDSSGKPVAGATVQLKVKEATQTQTVHSDSQGNYSFAAIQSGVYILRAEMAGYSVAEISSLFLAPKEDKHVDLNLVPEKNVATQPSPNAQPEFFDQPSFTVAGVTDTTSLGGHGSDTVVRTRESLAKETVSLGKNSAAAENSAALDAEKTLRASVEREPASFESNHRLGKLLVENGKAREAIVYLDRASALKRADYENSYLLALANSRSGNYERARNDTQALLDHSDKAELHHLLGDVQEKLGNSLAAVREYQRAAELEPTETYLFDWGSELLLHHAPEPAAEVFTKGNRLFPHSVRMLVGLAAAWFARGSYDQAVQRICEASDLNPSDSTPYLFLGKMQKAEATPSAEVLQKLQRFVEQQPANGEANYYYAIALWKVRSGSPNNSVKVESLLMNATRLNPMFAGAYVQLGIVHSENRDYSKAILDYQEAIHSDPKAEEAHYRLAQAYRQSGDRGKAEAELQIYNALAKESAQRTERERHEIRQFVYTLRDQPPPKVQE